MEFCYLQKEDQIKKMLISFTCIYQKIKAVYRNENTLLWTLSPQMHSSASGQLLLPQLDETSRDLNINKQVFCLVGSDMLHMYRLPLWLYLFDNKNTPLKSENSRYEKGICKFSQNEKATLWHCEFIK